MSNNNQKGMRPQNTLAPQGEQRFSGFITSDSIRKRINEMMGGKDGQRFVTSLVSAVTNNPALAKCDHMSIFSAAMLGESLGLSPSTELGQFYMVPYKDNKNGRTVATFQIGYKGYIQLAIRSGQYKKLNVLAIKEGELVSYDPLNEEIEVNLIQDDAAREEATTIGYYAMFEYVNGFRKTMYWSKEKMKAHADRYSKAFSSDKRYGTNNSFWSKDFDAMAYKTMLRQIISKWGVMSVEMQQAMAGDNAVLVNDVPQYIDAEPAPASGQTDGQGQDAPASADSFFDDEPQQEDQPPAPEGNGTELSEQQKKKIFATCKSRGLDLDQLCLTLSDNNSFGHPVQRITQLSKGEASQLIEWLDSGVLDFVSEQAA